MHCEAKRLFPLNTICGSRSLRCQAIDQDLQAQQRQTCSRATICGSSLCLHRRGLRHSRDHRYPLNTCRECSSAELACRRPPLFQLHARLVPSGIYKALGARSKQNPRRATGPRALRHPRLSKGRDCVWLSLSRWPTRNSVIQRFPPKAPHAVPTNHAFPHGMTLSLALPPYEIARIWKLNMSAGIA